MKKDIQAKKHLLACITSLCLLPSVMMAQGRAQEPVAGLGGRTFVYGQDVRLPQPITIDPHDPRPLAEILDEALRGTGITYRITESHVLLFAPPAASAQPVPVPTHTIYGYVVDHASSESLIGANIYVPLSKSGVCTNEYGHFSLTLPAGEVILETSYLGYGRDARSIRLTSDTMLIISLRPNRVLQEVMVDAVRPETGMHSSRSGASTIALQQILRMPALLGEADVIRSLQYQPGVQTTMSGQASMSVRGGDSDQNLFLLDGMMLYNVDHAMGFESAFMPDAVKHVDFFRGSFPARYGDRLSSITDVRTREGDLQHYHGTFSIGVLSSHLSVEGPIQRDRSSFLVSARRTYADWMINAFRQPLDISIDRFGLYFYDVNAKVNQVLGDADRLYLGFYRGRDVISVDDVDTSEYQGYKSATQTIEDLYWGNTLYHLRWNHLFSPRLFANTTIGYNRFTLSSLAEFRYRQYLDDSPVSDQLTNLHFRSGIDDLSASLDLDYRPSAAHHLRLGAQYTLHEFRPEVQSSLVRSDSPGQPSVDDSFLAENRSILAHETSVYAEDDFDLGRHWQFNAGLRATLFTTGGKTFPTLEPRLSACRVFGSGLRAKASYSLMHQYVHRISSSQIASPSDLWVPVTRDMRPMSAHQWSVGACYSPAQGWELGADAYWKEMYDVIDIIDGASFFGNSRAWETKVTSGRGRSYGLELYASKATGRTTGSVNYTLGKSDRWFPDGLINSGRTFPYRYDRRHVVHLLLQHQLTARIDLSAAWNFASGALVTVAKQQTEYVEPGDNILPGDYFSHRHNYRMKPTHQLDLGINFHRTTRHGERIWNVSLINAYCHLNQDMVFSGIQHEDQVVGTMPDGQPIVERQERRVLKQITVIPILPSVSYTYRF